MTTLALEKAEGLVFTLLYELPMDDFRLTVESTMTEKEVRRLRSDHVKYDKLIKEHTESLVTCDKVRDSIDKYIVAPGKYSLGKTGTILKNIKVKIPKWLELDDGVNTENFSYVRGTIFDYEDVVGKLNPGEVYSVKEVLKAFNIPDLVIDSLVVIDESEEYSDIAVIVDEHYIKKEVDKALGTLDDFRSLVSNMFDTGLCGFEISEGDGWYEYLTEVLNYDKETDTINYMLDRGDRIGWSDEWEYQNEEGEVSLEVFYDMCKNRVFGSQEAQVSFSTSLLEAVNRGGYYG